MFQKTDPLVYFDDNFSKYGPILTILSLLQQEIYDAQKLRYFSHLTFIMLPLYLAKQTLMLVSMQIFLDHAANKLVFIPMAKIFIYLFTAMLHDVTITSLLCLCIIYYKTDVYPPADSFVNGSTSVETLLFQSECPACIRQT